MQKQQKLTVSKKSIKKQIYYILAIIIFGACNSPNKTLFDALVAIDEMDELVSRQESNYLSFNKWKYHIYNDFDKALSIISEDPIDFLKISYYEPHDIPCYPHNYFTLRTDTMRDIAKLATLHDLLIKSFKQIKAKIEIKEELQANRDKFKSVKKYDDSIALVDNSINESVQTIYYYIEILNDYK